MVAGTAGAAQVHLGASLSAFVPRDSLFREIYGDGPDAEYGLTLGVQFWKGLSCWISGGQYMRNGETSYTKEITRLRIYPIRLALRYAFLGRRFSPFLEAGYLHLHVTEKTANEENTPKGDGYSLAVGTQIRLSSRFHLELNFRFSDVNASAGNTSIQMGGLAGGIVFFVRL